MEIGQLKSKCNIDNGGRFASNKNDKCGRAFANINNLTYGLLSYVLYCQVKVIGTKMVTVN